MSKQPRLMTVGCGVMVVREDKKILLGRRGQMCKRGKGLWALPGGMTDMGETVLEAMIREIYEETGIFVLPFWGSGSPPFTTTMPFAMTDHWGEENHLSMWYLAKVEKTTPKELLNMDIVPAKEPTKCEGWHWTSMQQLAVLPGVLDRSNDRSDSQYHWLPLDVFRATLPASLFGAF